MRLSYRTQRRLQRGGIVLLILLMLFIIAWFCSVVFLERYVVYTRDGAMLDLSISASAQPVDKEVPDWAMAAVIAMNDNGIAINGLTELTRGEVAVILYKASQLAPNAPGLTMYQ